MKTSLVDLDLDPDTKGILIQVDPEPGRPKKPQKQKNKKSVDFI
jgi:hypothetical protein